MPKTRKKTSPAQRQAARTAAKKQKKSEESAPAKGPKPHSWGKTGWCSGDMATTNVVASHLHCKPVIETPSVIVHCPCLCHVPGVLDIVRDYERTIAATCPICHGAGHGVKRKGEKMWKCEQGHRWPRKK